jgi:RHS repeat-associated protein
VTVGNHYGSGSDNPSWVAQISGGTVTTSRYLGALAGGLSVTSTTDVSTTTNSLTLADPGGSVVGTVVIPASGNATAISGYATTDEYGAGANRVDTGVVQYGWEGGAQRAIAGTGLTLMGARVYNAVTGRSTSTDPLLGGNENAYGYPDDPTVSRDLSGRNKTYIRTLWWGFQIILTENDTQTLLAWLGFGASVSGGGAALPAAAKAAKLATKIASAVGRAISTAVMVTLVVVGSYLLLVDQISGHHGIVLNFMWSYFWGPGTWWAWGR